PARLYLTDANGVAYFAPNTVQYQKVHAGFSENHFVPLKGTFTIKLAPGPYQLRIERGKENLPINPRDDIPSSGEVVRSFNLRRWIHMTDLGWYSGDMHVHAHLRDVLPLMQAEDLNAALPMTLWRMNDSEVSRDPDLATYLERADESGSVSVGK